MFIVTFNKHFTSGWLQGNVLECRITFPTMKLARDYRQVMEGKSLREVITGTTFVAGDFVITDDSLAAK